MLLIVLIKIDFFSDFKKRARVYIDDAKYPSSNDSPSKRVNALVIFTICKLKTANVECTVSIVHSIYYVYICIYVLLYFTTTIINVSVQNKIFREIIFIQQ